MLERTEQEFFVTRSQNFGVALFVKMLLFKLIRFQFTFLYDSACIPVKFLSRKPPLKQIVLSGVYCFMWH